MVVRCENCGQRGRIPNGRSPDQYVCGNCRQNRLVRAADRKNSPELALSGAMGGAVVGGAIGGPPGAVIGVVVGFLLGNKAAAG